MKKLIFVFFVFCSSFVFGQEYNYPLGNYYNNFLMNKICNADTIIHTSFKPLRVSYIEKSINQKDIFISQNRLDFEQKMPLEKVWDKIFVDDMVVIDKQDLQIRGNFLINYHKTKLQGEDDYKYWQNTRGFQVYGNLGKKISFYTDFFENQAYLLPYVQQSANNSLVVPGQGAWKPFGDDKLGRDYNYASGYLSYTPLEFLNIQFGRSKNFVGSGYRSMLLSDNAVVYPFMKFTLTKNKWQYVAMFSELENFKSKFYYYHHKKHNSILMLNYSPIKNMEIGFFESIMWHTTDSISHKKGIPALFFVPVPLFREAIYGLNNENNILIGLNFSYRMLKYAEIYSQFALDEFGKTDFDKRYSYQTGVKVFDVFNGKIKMQKLFLQAEYNYAKPYTYTHENSYSAFTQFNEPIVNTLGSGFNEKIGIVDWQFYGFEINFKYNNILTSSDTLGTNFGTNLMLSDNVVSFSGVENFVGQGNKTVISNYNITFAYLINTKNSLQIFMQLSKRNYLSETYADQDNLFFVSFGIKNVINNFYTDF